MEKWDKQFSKSSEKEILLSYLLKVVCEVWDTWCTVKYQVPIKETIALLVVKVWRVSDSIKNHSAMTATTRLAFSSFLHCILALY